jgi:hypothetical protein
MERLRVGATSSTTDVRSPAAEPLSVCAWSGLVCVLGHLSFFLLSLPFFLPLRLAKKVRTSW